MNFSIEGVPEVNDKGMTQIIDKVNGKSVHISPKNRKGVTYIRTQDRDGSYRYAITNSGNIIKLKDDVNGILDFLKKTNGAIEHHKNKSNNLKI